MSAENMPDPDFAFPFGQISEHTGQPINGYWSPGMTLRDYFAAQALSNRAGMLKNGVMYASDVATECYYIADAMLTAREASK
jgi:hypothetical protein